MHTMITAHSGCEGRPDNSLEYVQYALHCGADAYIYTNLREKEWEK